MNLKNLVIFFTLPSGFRSHSLVVTPGKLSRRENMMKWTMGSVKSDAVVKIEGTISGAFVEGLIIHPTYTIEFESEGSLISGYSLASATVAQSDKNPFIGVKYQAMNGKYQIQTGGFF